MIESSIIKKEVSLTKYTMNWFTKIYISQFDGAIMYSQVLKYFSFFSWAELIYCHIDKKLFIVTE